MSNKERHAYLYAFILLAIFILALWLVGEAYLALRKAGKEKSRIMQTAETVTEDAGS